MKHLCLLMFTAVFFDSFSQSILRGPYLQSPGPHSIIVRWRTDSLTDSRIYYNQALGDNSVYADSSTLTTEHRVLLKNLQPRTKYYYSVGSSTAVLRGADTLLSFITAPDTAAPVRFWAIGDFGHGNEAERKVRDSYVSFAANDRAADFQLWLGDNAYQDGTDEEFQTKVFDTVYGFGNVFLNLPFLSTSGNHDYNSICPWEPALCTQDPEQHTGPYLNIIDPPTEGELGGVASHRKIFYSFDYGDIHFVVLNSELGSLNSAYNWAGVLNNSSTFTSPMLDWLRADLAATTKKWKIALWHQCPYSGQNNFTEENSVQVFCLAARHHFNPIVEQYGVDLVLTGHDHNYQRSFLINGHYGGKTSFTPSMMINGSSGNDAQGEAYVKYTDGPNAGVGTVYLVQGNSSGSNGPDPFDHPAIYWGHACDTCFGSTIIDVSGDRLDSRYLTSEGQILDHFTIVKRTMSGIGDVDAAKAALYVFPNPVTSETKINYTLHSKGVVDFELQDMQGRRVEHMSCGMREPGDYSEDLDMSSASIPKGTYLLRFNFDGSVLYKRLIKL